MAQSTPLATSSRFTESDGSTASGVSWGAIFAGAAAAAALSLILALLGIGLGFAAVSPWANSGASAAALGIGAIVWIAFVQLAASGLGGYLAGRLRVKWTNVHDDEVYFRDTAHGFLAWAVATLVTAGFLASAVGNVAATGVQAGASLVGGAATAATAAGAGVATTAARMLPSGGAAGGSGNSGSGNDAGSSGYFVDALFRSEQAPAAPLDANTRSEVARIFFNAMRTGNLPPADQRYLGQVVARQTGIAPADAERRVADTFAQFKQSVADAEARARQAADEARKAGAHAAIWTFVGLLIGAFVASFAALFGGRRRDGVVS